MTSTVVEHASIEAKMVNAENLVVNLVRSDRMEAPGLGWYPRAFYRAHYLPDSLLDQWVAQGDVRMKKVNPEAIQSTAFFRLSDVIDKLESLADVHPKRKAIGNADNADNAARDQNLISAEGAKS